MGFEHAPARVGEVKLSWADAYAMLDFRPLTIEEFDYLSDEERKQFDSYRAPGETMSLEEKLAAMTPEECATMASFFEGCETHSDCIEAAERYARWKLLRQCGQAKAGRFVNDCTARREAGVCKGQTVMALPPAGVEREKVCTVGPAIETTRTKAEAEAVKAVKAVKAEKAGEKWDCVATAKKRRRPAKKSCTSTASSATLDAVLGDANLVELILHGRVGPVMFCQASRVCKTWYAVCRSSKSLLRSAALYLTGMDRKTFENLLAVPPVTIKRLPGLKVKRRSFGYFWLLGDEAVDSVLSGPEWTMEIWQARLRKRSASVYCDYSGFRSAYRREKAFEKRLTHGSMYMSIDMHGDSCMYFDTV